MRMNEPYRSRSWAISQLTPHEGRTIRWWQLKTTSPTWSRSMPPQPTSLLRPPLQLWTSFTRRVSRYFRIRQIKSHPTVPGWWASLLWQISNPWTVPSSLLRGNTSKHTWIMNRWMQFCLGSSTRRIITQISNSFPQLCFRWTRPPRWSPSANTHQPYRFRVWCTLLAPKRRRILSPRT